MTKRPSYSVISLLLMRMICVSGVVAGYPSRVWYDGSIEPNVTSLGSLLSDNAGFYGDSVMTGVSYTYGAANTPDNPSDTLADTPAFGRRLLDGKYNGDWYVPVGIVAKPVVVTFDFKRACTFKEVDISTEAPNPHTQQYLKIETANSPNGPWLLAYQSEKENRPAKPLLRIPLVKAVSGRYMRLTAGDSASGQQFLSEVWVWGNATVNAAYPEAVNPLYKELPAGYYSIPGVWASKFTKAQFVSWQNGLGSYAKQAAVISKVSTWSNISNRPILPTRPAVLNGQTYKLETARNMTEYVAVALTNTKLSDARAKVSLSDFRLNSAKSSMIKGEMRVMGAMQTRTNGVQLTPMFTADNLLSSGLMKRYVNNGSTISSFPNITLTPGGSAVLWISIQTKNALPGTYSAKLSFSGGKPVTISLKVNNITLPAPFVWLRTWSTNTSAQIPFNYSDRMVREVRYARGLGINVWNGFPAAGNDVADARKMGKTISSIFGVPHWEEGYPGGWQTASIPAAYKQDIAKYISATVTQAKAAGLGYDEWHFELWDEPGMKNGLSFGALARVIKQINPDVRIYCDPCSWKGSGWATDEAANAAYAPWYNSCVDISVPSEGMDNPKTFPLEWSLWNAPRFVRAFYEHPTEKKPESGVELVRRQAWKAFSRGWNGWGTYSYCSPGKDPWNDMDDIEGDHLMAFPGPNGPVATRRSEGIRAGWEDYCLLSLMRSRGLKAELDTVLARYKEGTALQTLRQMMINYLK